MRLTPYINKTIKMMSQREYNWPFCYTNKLSRLMLGLGFNDAAMTIWLLNSHATVHWYGCSRHVICIRGT